MSQTKTEDMSKEDREDNESLSDTGDVTLHNEKIKEEEQEAEEQPAAKKMREQSQSESEEKKEHVKTGMMKGKPPVDPECKDKLGKAHVYTEGDDVYYVMLNQTDIQEKNSNNKYYEIQLLKDHDAKVFTVKTRCGRVGYKGKSRDIYTGGDLEKAKKVFKDKFLEKTMNKWEKRRNLKKVDGQYDMVLIDHTTDEKPSELNDRIQSLLKLIGDPEAPLGKLTSEQIDAGYEALKSIKECLTSDVPNQDELVKASNTFYSRIPHGFRFKIPPIIHTEDELKKKIALLEFLKELSDSDEHPLDRLYRSLQYDLQPLDSSSDDYQVIEKYLKTTQGNKHSKYTMTIVDIFSVNRKGESDNFRSDLNNRTLLWYGYCLSNWVSILREGLRVAPPKAGSNFGEGIYFADMSSKSATYCKPSQNNPEGLLLLCEVALGDCNELQKTNPKASNLPPGKHSTMGLGQTIPDPKNSVTLGDVIVPMGPEVTRKGYSLHYNQYVVYDPAQVRMKYLLRIRFNYC